MLKPQPTTGLRHVALFVKNFEDCVKFYTELLGMQIEWQPDPDNVYLTSGNDNLALHRAPEIFQADKYQKLDHIGFIINAIGQIDSWYEFFKKNNVSMKTEPRTHRDGARSFYCLDPDGNTIQIIYHPPLAKENLFTLAQHVGELLKQKKLMLATAESCTGGLVAEIITQVAGSSNWLERGFVTYSNLAKQEMLSVPAKTIEAYGAVSEQTAQAMAEGALKHSHATVSLAITGIAGPEGGTQEKPVGTVWFAWASKNAATQMQLQTFHGDRLSIREQAAQFVLQNLIDYLRVS